MHQTTQLLLGVLLMDVMKAHPKEWTELLPVVEFAVYNTPGAHGFTPRDLDRRWSVVSLLVQDLTPFEVLEFESLFFENLVLVRLDLKRLDFESLKLESLEI